MIFIINRCSQKKVAQYFLTAGRKNCQARIPYPEKISFRNEGEIKTFSEKGKLKECITGRLIVKERVKDVL